MTTPKNDDFAQRVHDALHALPSSRQGKLMAEHRQAYAAMISTVQGIVRPDGLTDEGTVKMNALGAAVGVSRDHAPAPAAPAKK